jgi:sugar/nucleoside kinase (ribokinase family)
MRVPEKQFDVIVVGELNVDIILNDIAQFPAIGKEILANEMAVTLGSSSAIFASNLSSLGSRVAFIGKIGKDSFADLVFNSLQNKLVDTSRVMKSDALCTGATLVLNFGQDRAMVTYQGAMNDLRLEDIDFNFLAQARHMHLSSCFIQPGIRKDLPELFRKVKELGLTTSLDTQWDPEEKWELSLEKLLPNVDVFMPNAQEFQFMTRAASMAEGIKKISSFSNTLVIKDGIRGSWAWNGSEVIHQPVFLNSQVVDCIGAGDSFNAGFIRQFTLQSPLSKCLEFGSLTGAINTTRAGGTAAFESPEIIRSIALETFKYTL